MIYFTISYTLALVIVSVWQLCKLFSILIKKRHYRKLIDTISPGDYIKIHAGGCYKVTKICKFSSEPIVVEFCVNRCGLVKMMSHANLSIDNVKEVYRLSDWRKLCLK